MDNFKLKDDQVAFVINKNWEMELHLPKASMDDEFVNDYITYIIALAVLTKNDDFINEVFDRFHNLEAVKKAIEEAENEKSTDV